MLRAAELSQKKEEDEKKEKDANKIRQLSK
jgi:hypothetical protein